MEDDRLAKWLAQTYTTDNTNEESDLADIIKTVDQFSIDPIDEDRLFDKIQLKRKQAKQVKKTYTLQWISGIAASIALIIGINHFFFNQTSFSSPIQEIALHTLPDGSRLTLNGNSKIDYKSKFDQRILSLDGEAFFEVEKGSSFIVNTKLGNIEVLGTSFNIFSRDSFLIVSCATGKVQVNSKVNSQILIAGQKAVLHANKLVLESVDPKKVKNWDGNETSFEKTSLPVVLSSLSHHYNIHIQHGSIDMSSLQFTGSFLHNDLEKAVKMVLLPFNINYEIRNQKDIFLSQ